MRYTVLEHYSLQSVHWDLCLEWPMRKALETWGLERPLTNSAGQAVREVVEAWRLPPHRAIYLRYEGPISGMRGWVKRWDAGAATVLVAHDELVRVRLSGGKICGVVELSMAPRSDDRWLCRYSPTYRPH
ncbi:MAG: hypothetical protein ACRC1K_26610 [Planctomycetia bacterium]